jgi:hypothetical protein
MVGRVAPDLAAEPEIVVDDSDSDTALGRASGGDHPGWTSANHEYIEMALRFPVHRFQFFELQFSTFSSQLLLPFPVRTAPDSFCNAECRRSQRDIQSKFPCHIEGRAVGR